MKDLLKSAALFLVPALVMGFFTACETENVAADEEYVALFTDQAVFEVQKEGNCGKFGCFEFVFPITLNFADGSTAEVGSYEDMRAAIGEWKSANPEATERPTLSFPLEVMTDSAEVITINSREEMRDLARKCRREYYGRHNHRSHRGKGDRCFELVYPITLVFPDESESEATDSRTLKELLRSWRLNNPGSTERPELKFPLTVKLEDGSQVTVESREALGELKDTCSAS